MQKLLYDRRLKVMHLCLLLLVLMIYLNSNKNKFINLYGVAHTQTFDKLTKEQQQAYFAQTDLNSVNLSNTSLSMNELTNRQQVLNQTTSNDLKTQMSSISVASNIDSYKLENTMLQHIDKANETNISKIQN